MTCARRKQIYFVSQTENQSIGSQIFFKYQNYKEPYKQAIVILYKKYCILSSVKCFPLKIPVII